MLPILLNMIHWVHLEVVRVQEVRLAWPAIQKVKDPLRIQFPGQWTQLSFPLDIGELLDDIDVEIKLGNTQASDVTAKIVDTMSIWLLASHRSAYADDFFNPSKSAIYLGPDVMDVSSDRIIWFIEIMRCDSSALS